MSMSVIAASRAGHRRSGRAAVSLCSLITRFPVTETTITAQNRRFLSETAYLRLPSRDESSRGRQSPAALAMAIASSSCVRPRDRWIIATPSAFEKLSVPHGTPIRARRERGVSLERCADVSRARRLGLPAFRVPSGAPPRELPVRDLEPDASVRNIDRDEVARLDQTDRAAFGGFGRDVADR